MSDPIPVERKTVTVREFAAGAAAFLELEVLQGQEGMDNEIRSDRIQKLGLALAGFLSYGLSWGAIALIAAALALGWWSLRGLYQAAE